MGKQSGDRSLNVGQGDFRGSNVHVGDYYIESSDSIPIDLLNINRNIILGGASLNRRNTSIFGVMTGLASLVGLYFTMFPFAANPSDWSLLFIFLFGVGVMSVSISFAIGRLRFSCLLFRRYYLEVGSREGLYLTNLMATCPWCGSKMTLSNIGPKDGPKEDVFVCRRNSKHHRVTLDPTALDDIEE